MAVHERGLSFVPWLATPPPRSRRRIRAPLSLLRILAGPSLYAILTLSDLCSSFRVEDEDALIHVLQGLQRC
jgi:hypothetical protein